MPFDFQIRNSASQDRLDSLTTKQLEEIAEALDWEAQAGLWGRL